MELRRRALLAVFLALLASWQLSAKEAPKALLSRLPERLADCQRGELADYGDPRLGASIAYHADGLTITVYAYDQGRPTIADGLADPVVQEAFQMAKRDIQAAAQRGDYSDVRLLSEGRGTFHQREATLLAKYELTRQKEPDEGLKVFSEIHVFGAWNHIFKLRISGKLDAQEKLAPTASRFVAELLKAIEYLPPAQP
jgi:hypothetical protein